MSKHTGENDLEPSPSEQPDTVDVDENSAAHNIKRSKQLIETLRQTTQRSQAVVQKARAFQETYKMLSVSKEMSEKSKAQLRISAALRKVKDEQS